MRRNYNREDDYCTFIYPSGRKCRAGKVPTRDVCLYHWRKDGEFVEDASAVAKLLEICKAITTPQELVVFLMALMPATLEGTIPHRKAALLTYQAQIAIFGTLARDKHNRRMGRPPMPIPLMRDMVRLLLHPPAVAEAERQARTPNGKEAKGSHHGSVKRSNGSAANGKEAAA